MSIITTATGLANFSLGLFGGAGDQISASGQLADLTGTDRITVHVNTYLPFARQKAILDLARLGLPFRETFKFADLGDDLKQDDVSLDAIVGGGAAVTITTQSAHGFSIGDTIFLTGIEGSDYTSLNDSSYTITVTTTPTMFASSP